jgi:hypothetical protein
MIEINLIPDVKRELIKTQRMRAYVISGSIITSIVAGGVIVLLLLYIGGVQTFRESTLDNAITKQSEELAKVEDLSKILTIQNQLAAIDTQGKQKQLESRVFDVVGSVVPPAPNEVKVSKINVDATTSKMTLDGQTPAYASVQVLQKTLENAIFTYKEGDEEKTVNLAEDIKIEQASYGKDENDQRVVVFTISFTYPEQLFSSKVPNLVIKFKNNGNVTDSYLGIPRVIYTQPATKDGAN